MKTFRRVALLSLGWGGLAVAAVGALLHWLPLTHYLLVAATAFAPAMMLCGVISAIAFGILRAKLPAAAIAVVVVIGLITQAPLVFSSNFRADGSEISVMVSNIELGKGDTSVLERQVESGVDVLAVLELTPAAAERINLSGIAKKLPYQFVRASNLGRGTGVWSRYPISEGQLLPGMVLHGLRMHIQGPHPFTFFALHPLPPGKNNNWGDESSTVRKHLAAAPRGPVIAAGDYNATWDHKHFRRLLTGGYRDAAIASGDAPQFTWPTDEFVGPLVGIDHILLRGIQALSVKTVHVPDADHRALVARVRLPVLLIP